MAKPTDTADRVNAATVRGEFMFLLGEICRRWRCEVIVTMPVGSSGLSRPRRGGMLSTAASEPDNEHERGTQRALEQSTALSGRSQQRP